MSEVLDSHPNFVANTQQEDGKGSNPMHMSESGMKHWLLLAHTHICPLVNYTPSQPNQKSQTVEVHFQISRALLKLSSQAWWLTYVVPAYRRLKLED